MTTATKSEMQAIGNREELEKLTIPSLLRLATVMNVRGRWKMKKEQLVDILAGRPKLERKAVTVKKAVKQNTLEEVLATEEEWAEKAPKEAVTKNKHDYIESAKIGTIIAFKVTDKKALSGKIEEIGKSQFLVKTKNGVLFTVKKENVLWVKTTSRWPKGVYLALKGEARTSGH